MSNKNYDVTELLEDSSDIQGDSNDDVSSSDEFEDACEFFDEANAINTSIQNKTKQTYSNTSLSTEKLADISKVDFSTNTVVTNTTITDTNEVINTLQDDIETASSLEELEIVELPICKEDSNVVVVAIDFGTTYSGWAFSLREQFQNDKLDIQTNGGWKSGDGLITPKVPTCILFDKNEEFRSFGYEAESTYAELIDENNAEGWRFFSRFKMSLFCDEDGSNESFLASHVVMRKICSRVKIKDVQGHRMSAVKVFSESLKFLKNDFLEVLHLRLPWVPLHYISWILTVPAIWTDKAKQFMRLAALEAGIPGTRLVLAYEPEAAALYCRESTYQRKGQLKGHVSAFSTGESILVLDCGGGTVDVTAYEIVQNGRMKELHEPTGGPWGGTMVDHAFMEFMEDVFGTTVWNKFKSEYMSEVLDIQRHFEAKKRTIGENSERKEINLQFPRDLFDAYKEIHSKDFTSINGVSRHKDKLKISKEKIVSLFEETTTAIVNHLHTLLKKKNLARIHTILMVGGYSDSALLRRKIIDQLSNITVICPDDAVLFVVKGAVIFGRIPNLNQERICPRTYGIACNQPFNAEIHPSALKYYYDQKAVCRDIFKVLVRKGDSVIIGKDDFKTIFHPTRELDTKATVGIYSSSEQDPMFIYGINVQELGVLELDMKDLRKGGRREIIVSLIFKSTELTVVAKEGNNVVCQKFNCLG